MEDEGPVGFGPETLLDLATKLLQLGDFSAARKYALLARNSHPNPNPNSIADQIISISDVLLAAKTPPTVHSPDLIDHYSVLRLERPLRPVPDWETAVRNHFLKLFADIHPAKDALPFGQDALNLICEARSVLSNPDARARYDQEVFRCGEQEVTFWTVCPYCFYLYQYDGVYEDCCLRCQNCGKPFHAGAVEPPPAWQVHVADDGTEEYYHGVGMFPVKYRLDSSYVGLSGGISSVSGGRGGGGGGSPSDGRRVGNGKPKGKKMTGRGKKRSGAEGGLGFRGNGGGNGVENDLEFFIRDDDIYISIKDETD